LLYSELAFHVWIHRCNSSSDVHGTISREPLLHPKGLWNYNPSTSLTPELHPIRSIVVIGVVIRFSVDPWWPEACFEIAITLMFSSSDIDMSYRSFWVWCLALHDGRVCSSQCAVPRCLLLFDCKPFAMAKCQKKWLSNASCVLFWSMLLCAFKASCSWFSSWNFRSAFSPAPSCYPVPAFRKAWFISFFLYWKRVVRIAGFSSSNILI
jgi:hypothetical protein